MTALLTVLTVVEIVLVIGALAWYLARISRSLHKSAASLSRVTFGVRAIETQCSSIGPNVVKVNGQLAVIAGALDALATQAETLAARGT